MPYRNMIRPIRPIGPAICALGAMAPIAQTDEQHGADAEREAEDVDLPDRVAETDCEKEREDRLRCRSGR